MMDGFTRRPSGLLVPPEPRIHRPPQCDVFGGAMMMGAGRPFVVQSWTTFGAAFSFVVPVDVTVIKGAYLVAGGDGAWEFNGGAGGGFRYWLDIPVTPGETVTGEVGQAGPGNRGLGGNSSLTCAAGTVVAYGGSRGGSGSGGTGGNPGGQGGAKLVSWGPDGSCGGGAGSMDGPGGQGADAETGLPVSGAGGGGVGLSIDTATGALRSMGIAAGGVKATGGAPGAYGQAGTIGDGRNGGSGGNFGGGGGGRGLIDGSSGAAGWGGGGCVAIVY